MRILLSPDPVEPTAPAVETPAAPPAAPEPTPAPAPEAPAIVAKTSTDRTPRERELEIRLSEVENERDNLKRSLYELKPDPRAKPARKGFLADAEAELTGKA